MRPRTRIVRSGSVSFDLLAQRPEVAPRPIDDRSGERTRIVKRLQAVIATHAESARRMGLGWALPDVERVIEALEAETDGLDPFPYLDGADDVRSHLRRSLFEELLGEPSNIFYTTQVSADTARYEPLPKDFWKECLARLRGRLATMERKRP